MTEIRLAQSGMGMTDGTITAWHKGVGDTVEKGELLCDIEAAKTTIEYESPISGVITKILVNADENVPVNTVIAEIEERKADTAPTEESSIGSTAEPQRKDSQSGREKATPLARRVASDHDVDIKSINGTGPRGKVRRDDVVKAMNEASCRQESSGANVQVEPRARKVARDLNIDLARISGTGPNGRIVAEDVISFNEKTDDEKAAKKKKEEPPLSKEETGYKDVTHTMMRRTIAKRLAESKQTVPHFYLKASCRIDELQTLRTQVNKTSEIKISINDFLIRAIALALIDTPDANVTWDEKAIRKYSFTDISVAVATPRGLVTPVIRKAESKRLHAIAEEVKELAARGREGKLKPEEYQGGVTTISNLGMYGAEEFSAILNPPQSTIFAIGSSERRMIVVEDKPEVASMMNVVMSVDHRAVDGAVAAQLMSAFKGYVENPMRILL